MPKTIKEDKASQYLNPNENFDFRDTLDNLAWDLKLHDDKTIWFSTSVIICCSDGTMRVPKLAYHTLGDGISFEDTVSKNFRWKVSLRSTAGLCAATSKIYFIPNLKNDQLRVAIEWFPIRKDQSDKLGGIVTVPIVGKPRNSSHEMEYKCLAVLSISCGLADFLMYKHLNRIWNTVKEIQSLIAKKTGQDYIWYNSPEIMTEREINYNIPEEQPQSPEFEEVVRAVLSVYQNLPSEEQLELLSHLTRDFLGEDPKLDLEKVDATIDTLVENLHDNHRVQHPTKHELILEMLRLSSKCGQGVPFDRIVQLYENNEFPDRNATDAIGKLNKHLKEHNLRIERSSEYSLIAISPNT